MNSSFIFLDTYWGVADRKQSCKKRGGPPLGVIPMHEVDSFALSRELLEWLELAYDVK